VFALLRLLVFKLNVTSFVRFLNYWHSVTLAFLQRVAIVKLCADEQVTVLHISQGGCLGDREVQEVKWMIHVISAQ